MFVVDYGVKTMLEYNVRSAESTPLQAAGRRGQGHLNGGNKSLMKFASWDIPVTAPTTTITTTIWPNNTTGILGKLRQSYTSLPKDYTYHTNTIFGYIYNN